MLKRNISLVCMALFFCIATAEAESVSVKSPNGRNEIRLIAEDVLQYAVFCNGKLRVAPSVISMSVENHGRLGERPVIIKSVRNKVKGVIKTPIYKKAEIVEEGSEVVVYFEGGYQVVLRAYNDGVAYRFKTELDGKIKIIAEDASLIFPTPDLTAYVGYNTGNKPGKKYDRHQNSRESIYEKVRVADILPEESGLVYLPLLLEYDDGVCMCVTESDLRDYPGWNLCRKGDHKKKLTGSFARYPVVSSIKKSRLHRYVTERKAWMAETGGTRSYPWRVFVLAENPADLIESDMAYKLASPRIIEGDCGWIKPGKVAWEWWNARNISGVDFRAGINTRTYKYYIDFAQKNNIEYIILDGGWSVPFNIMKYKPEVNVPELIQYAEERGVGIILWAAWPEIHGSQHEVFKHYAEMGAKGFKIDFMDRDDQIVVNFVEETARVAAEYELIIDYHGMYKPTGIQRAYPNILNFEGVFGLEMAKFRKSGMDFPKNDTQIVFTRMVAGPLDYTPGAMRNQTKKGFRSNSQKPASQGTRVHQMALMSIFEAPLQMLCDSPTQYMRNQECTDFMAAVPTVWDETVGMDGIVGEYAVLARRRGKVWYISAITNWEARELTLDLSFLSGGYNAEIFADGINADRDATDYRYVEKRLNGGSELKIRLAPGGGWTSRIEPM
ncbi:MAG: glycoside hydrolase family 97 protein [Kiritimatiellia bacterium]